MIKHPRHPPERQDTIIRRKERRRKKRGEREKKKRRKKEEKEEEKKKKFLFVETLLAQHDYCFHCAAVGEKVFHLFLAPTNGHNDPADYSATVQGRCREHSSLQEVDEQAT